jgi:hypothetical protein
MQLLSAAIGSLIYEVHLEFLHAKETPGTAEAQVPNSFGRNRFKDGAVAAIQRARAGASTYNEDDRPFDPAKRLGIGGIVIPVQTWYKLLSSRRHGRRARRRKKSSGFGRTKSSSYHSTEYEK